MDTRKDPMEEDQKEGGEQEEKEEPVYHDISEGERSEKLPEEEEE